MGGVSSETFQRIQKIKKPAEVHVGSCSKEVVVFVIGICSLSPPHWCSAASWTGSAEDTLRSFEEKKCKKSGEQMKVCG